VICNLSVNSKLFVFFAALLSLTPQGLLNTNVTVEVVDDTLSTYSFSSSLISLVSCVVFTYFFV